MKACFSFALTLLLACDAACGGEFDFLKGQEIVVAPVVMGKGEWIVSVTDVVNGPNGSSFLRGTCVHRDGNPGTLRAAVISAKPKASTLIIIDHNDKVWYYDQGRLGSTTPQPVFSGKLNPEKAKMVPIKSDKK